MPKFCRFSAQISLRNRLVRALFGVARPPKLEPYLDSQKNRWTVSISAKLSPTGRRKREFFETKGEAQLRATQLKELKDESLRAVRTAGAKLIKVAVNYDDLFRIVYGFENGLEEACEAFAKQLDEATQSITFGELLDRYYSVKSGNWKGDYLTTWKTFRKHVAELDLRPLVGFSSDCWQDWLDETAATRNWSDRTFNDVASLLSGIWKYALSKELVARNVIDGVQRRKVRKKAVAVYSVEQVEAIMNAAWEHDREMVPFFALAIFAGLRPDENGEIANLVWEDAQFDQGWIRVGANFENKTETKRFVPLEENLKL